MRGKYSPTVSVAYQKNQQWWYEYSGANKPSAEYVQYDRDGYDSYGYDSADEDRAGNHESVYYGNDAPMDSDDEYNLAYDVASDEWGFDGEKPVRRST